MAERTVAVDQHERGPSVLQIQHAHVAGNTAFIGVLEELRNVLEPAGPARVNAPERHRSQYQRPPTHLAASDGTVRTSVEAEHEHGGENVCSAFSPKRE